MFTILVYYINNYLFRKRGEKLFTKQEIKRLKQISTVLVKHELGFILDKIKAKKYAPLSSKLNKSNFLPKHIGPKRLVKIFEELGGAFIKLGQLLSVRPDLIPEEYTIALRSLQDHVPEFSCECAKQIIERELGKKPNKLFRKFVPKPIAAASISQVHYAVLRSGEKVAIKIQRPDALEQFSSDIGLMKKLVNIYLKNHKPKLIDPHQIISEFEQYTMKELDFLNEAKNLQNFYQMFENTKDIIIPKVYWEYTTANIVVMEYIEGKPLTDVSRLKPKTKRDLANKLFDNVVRQVFFKGYFHADPHPGNFLLLKNRKLAMLDFGIVGKIDEVMKDKIGMLYVSMIEGDLDGIVKHILKLGIAGPGCDKDLLKHDLRENLRVYHNTPLSKLNVGEFFSKLISVARRNKLKLPSSFVLLAKSLVTIEGLGKELNPRFNLVQRSKPLVAELKQQKLNPEHIKKKLMQRGMEFKEILDDIPQDARAVKELMHKMEQDVVVLDNNVKVLTGEMDRSSNRLSFGILISALVIASAIMISQPGPQMFGINAFSFFGLSISLVLFLLLSISILREKSHLM